MEPQKPAEGILKTTEWGDSKWYHIRCECGSDDCSHELNVEADAVEVQVHIYAKNYTKWWEKNRWQQIWQILTRGYSDMQTTIVLKEQVAINYATALTNAVDDVKKFKADYWAKKKEVDSPPIE
jgi:hypothetical protein